MITTRQSALFDHSIQTHRIDFDHSWMLHQSSPTVIVIIESSLREATRRLGHNYAGQFTRRYNGKKKTPGKEIV